MADDPFVNSPDVFKRIAFFGLTVTFAGSGTVALDVGQALNGTGEGNNKACAGGRPLCGHGREHRIASPAAGA